MCPGTDSVRTPRDYSKQEDVLFSSYDGEVFFRSEQHLHICFKKKKRQLNATLSPKEILYELKCCIVNGLRSEEVATTSWRSDV